MSFYRSDLGEGEQASFGDLMRHWRSRRRLSQMQLALQARVSARHISFLEVGRARPSDAMVETLARALDLAPEEKDALRTAAGFAVRHRPLLLGPGDGRPMPEPELANGLFQTALSFEAAITPEELAQSAKPLLATLGMQHFFLFTVQPQRLAPAHVQIENPGSFPEKWMSRYQARYSAVDPLVQQVTSRNTGFFWDEVGAVSRPGPSRQLFDEGARLGLTMGFVTFVRNFDGSARTISMLGNGADTRDRRVRFSLQTLGLALLDRLDRIEGDRRLPPG